MPQCREGPGLAANHTQGLTRTCRTYCVRLREEAAIQRSSTLLALDTST